jgi:hypothetical protein
MRDLTTTFGASAENPVQKNLAVLPARMPLSVTQT